MKQSVLQIILEDVIHYYEREIALAESDMVRHDAFAREKEYNLARKACDYLRERHVLANHALQQIKREDA